MIGKTILHYKILAKLGEGGMGVVYKAEDTKLKRTVALKFLPSSIMASEAEKTRFVHEAQTAAALDHPNICTIYEIDEADGQLFIAMAYIAGQSLKERIAAGPLKLDEGLNIAMQVADGLQAAHEKRITHRDIKPANIMITTKGQAKIMDFGLAKLAGRTAITKEGMTLGTVAYMSPEQARGEEVDHRTDIWAFGVVLYEMISGQHPFKGEYDQAVMYSVCHETPEPITGLRTGVPMELEQVVNKCLEKDAAKRYQHIDDVPVDLRRISEISSTKKTASRPVTIRKVKPAILWPTLILSAIVLAMAGYFFFGQKEENTERVPIAVVDFVNQTNEPELNSLSGMLITALEQSRRLAVFSRARMYDEFKQMDRPDLIFVDEAAGREIAKRASISALAVATIRKFGQLYTIDFKVIEPQSGDRLFSTKVEGTGQESIPGLIDQVAEKTRIDLKEEVKVVQLTSRRIVEVTTSNLQAYQHYFRGVEFIGKLNFSDAEEELKKAIALDSTFASAHYRLAIVYGWRYAQGSPLIKPPLRKAMQYLNNAPDKDQRLIQAEDAMNREKYKESFDKYEEVINLYPADKEVLFALGDLIAHYAAHFGRTRADSRPYFEKALAIDPTYEPALQHLSSTSFGGTLADAKRYVANVPTSVVAWDRLGQHYMRRAEYDSALQTLEAGLERFPENVQLRQRIGRVHILRNEYEKAAAEFQKLLHKTRPLSDQRVGYEQLALVYAYQGKHRKLIETKNRVIEIDRALGDNAGLARIYAQIAFWYLVGRGDKTKSEQAMAQSHSIETLDDELNLLWYRFRVYLLMADYERAFAIANGKNQLEDNFGGHRLSALVNGYIHRASGDYARAIESFQQVDLFVFELARTYFVAGQFEEAITVIQEMHQKNLIDLWPERRAADYPRTFYLLGKIYEQQSDNRRAIENYEKFLNLWKDADEDLTELIDAKARYAKLKGMPEK